MSKEQVTYENIPKITIGEYTIRNFQDPEGSTVWIERLKDYEASEFSKEALSDVLGEFYKENF